MYVLAPAGIELWERVFASSAKLQLALPVRGLEWRMRIQTWHWKFIYQYPMFVQTRSSTVYINSNKYKNSCILSKLETIKYEKQHTSSSREQNVGMRRCHKSTIVSLCVVTCLADELAFCDRGCRRINFKLNNNNSVPFVPRLMPRSDYILT